MHRGITFCLIYFYYIEVRFVSLKCFFLSNFFREKTVSCNVASLTKCTKFAG